MRLFFEAFHAKSRQVKMEYGQKNHQEAKELLLSSLKEHPNSAELLKAQGLICYLESNFKEALASFDSAYQAKPQDKEAFYCVAAILNDLGFYQKASALLFTEPEVTEDEAYIQVCLDQASALRDLRKDTEALQVLTFLSLEYPFHLAIGLSYCAILIDLGRLDEALVVAETLQERHSESHENYILMGFIYHQKGQKTRAYTLWAKAYALCPGDSKSRILAALASRYS